MNLIIKHQSKLKKLLIVFVIFEGIFIFPLSNYWSEFSYSNIMLLAGLAYAYAFCGNISKILYSTSKYRLVLIFFVCNCIGFSLRLWLEWGEYSMVRDLNMVNFMSTYLVLTIMFSIGLLMKSKHFLGDM